jgi:hypothetical protein
LMKALCAFDTRTLETSFAKECIRLIGLKTPGYSGIDFFRSKVSRAPFK